MTEKHKAQVPPALKKRRQKRVKRWLQTIAVGLAAWMAINVRREFRRSAEEAEQHKPHS